MQPLNSSQPRGARELGPPRGSDSISLAQRFGRLGIVVGVMVSRGFDIQLDEIASTPGAGDAFVDGWRTAYIVVTGFSAIGLLMAFLTKSHRVPANGTA